MGARYVIENTSTASDVVQQAGQPHSAWCWQIDACEVKRDPVATYVSIGGSRTSYVHDPNVGRVGRWPSLQARRSDGVLKGMVEKQVEVPVVCSRYVRMTGHIYQVLAGDLVT